MPIEGSDYRELRSPGLISNTNNVIQLKRDIGFFKRVIGDLDRRLDRIEKRELFQSNRIKSMIVGDANLGFVTANEIYVPNDTSTPRVQITSGTHGGFAILGSGDTYNESTGAGTYEVLFDYAASTPGLYFADGAAYIGSSGITVSGSGTLMISATTTNPVVTRIVDVYTAVANTSGSPAITGIYSRVEKTTSNSFSTLYGIRTQVDSTLADGTLLRGVNAVVIPGGGIITTATGVYSQVTTLGTVTNANGLHVSLSTTSGTLTTGIGLRIEDMAGTNQRAISIEAPTASANSYAIYSSAAAQSVHAGNFRIGSTTAPTVALNVTGDVTVDPSTAGDAIIAHSNGSANAAAGVSYSAAVPATSTTGDLRFVVTLIGTKAWSWGLDNSDSDAWVLSENATLGTSNRIRTLGNLVELLTTAKATANGWYIKGGTAAYGADTAGVLLDLVFDTAGTDLAVNMIHSATSGAGHAVLNLSTHPSGTGDPQVHFRISGTQSWRIGVDNSAADNFVISRGTGLGTNNVLSISTADDITLADGVDIVLNTTTGTKIGTGTTQKLGFFNATPVARPTAFTQTYSTASHTHTQTTMTNPAAYAAGANGYSTGAMASAIHAEVIALRANMVVVQDVVNAIIDDLQALGLFG